MNANCPMSLDVLRAPLKLLYEAYTCADDVGVDHAEFAIDIGVLQNAGLSITGLRWLCKKQYVRHLLEAAFAGDDKRAFRQGGQLIFHQQSNFVLTDKGAMFASSVLANSPGKTAPPLDELVAEYNTVEPPATPVWDSDARELRAGKVLVKKYRQPAPTQERVLAAFEEEYWARCIDDPLSPKPNIDARERLHSTIQRLNQSQVNRLIVFAGDGTGERIIWNWAEHT